MSTIPQSPGKILIIRLSSIGDIILTTPVVRALRQNFPQAQIDFVVASEYRALLENHPGISHLLVLDKSGGGAAMKALRNQIRANHYDLIIDLHRNLRTYRLTRFPGCPPLLRFRKNILRRFLLVNFKINLLRDAPPVPRRYLNALNPLGITDSDLAPELHLSDSLRQQTRQRWGEFAADSLRIVIAPGARHFTKRWPGLSYQTLIRRIYREYGCRPLLVGGPSERELCDEIHSQAGSETAITLAADLSLMETIALISQAHYFISNDSGLMHAAAAFQIPQIAIFGSTTRELGFFPVNPKAMVLENAELGCRPCSHIGKSACPKGHFACMAAISPDKVLQALHQLIETYPAIS